MKNLFINKKTISEINKPHLEQFLISFDDSIISQEQFLKDNRQSLIDIKDTILNRDNLTTFQKDEKLNLLKSKIENNQKLPLNYFRPIGIRTDTLTTKNLTNFIDKQKTSIELRTIEIQRDLDNSFLNETTPTPKPTKKK